MAPGDVSERKENIFFIVVMFIVSLDGLAFGFRIAWPVRAIVYLLLSIAAIRVYKVDLKSQESIMFCVIGALSFLAGHVLTTRDIILQYPVLRFVVIFAPVWMIYYIFTEHTPLINTIAHIYAFFWLAWFLIWLFFGGASHYIGDLEIGGKSVINPWEVIKTMFANLKRDIVKVINYPLFTNQSDFFGQGTVENNKGQQLGVYIENVRMVDPIIYTNNAVTALADIKVRSFVSPVNLENSCSAKKVAYDVTTEIPGNMGDTAKMDDLMGETYDIASCDFPPFQEGTHTLWFKSKFNFETWSYITYTFMDKSLYRSLLSQQRNINLEYDIDPNPIPVYTNGPLEINLAAIYQPISVDPEKPSLITPLAIELKNHWPGQGRFLSLEEVKVLLPSEISLRDCTTTGGLSTETIDGTTFRTYIFKDLKITVPSSPYYSNPRIKTIVCRLDVDPAMLATNPVKAEKTFAIRAKYTYELFSETTFIVEKEPGS